MFNKNKKEEIKKESSTASKIIGAIATIGAIGISIAAAAANSSIEEEKSSIEYQNLCKERDYIRSQIEKKKGYDIETYRLECRLRRIEDAIDDLLRK